MKWQVKQLPLRVVPAFYSQRGIGVQVFDAQLGWWILGYNRCYLHALGKRVPPDTMPPKVRIIVVLLFSSLSHSWITLIYMVLLSAFVQCRCVSTTLPVHGLPWLIHSCCQLWGQGQNRLQLWALCAREGRADGGWFLRGSTVYGWQSWIIWMAIR